MVDPLSFGIIGWVIETVAEEALKEGGKAVAQSFIAYVKKKLMAAHIKPGEMMGAPSSAWFESAAKMHTSATFGQGQAEQIAAAIAHNLRQVGSQLPNTWVPENSEGLCGIDISGVWAPQGQSSAPTYIRQFGPYFNVLKPPAENPPLYAEGLINPATGFLFFYGQYVPGPPLNFEGQLTPKGTISGIMSRPSPSGQQALPMEFVRVQ